MIEALQMRLSTHDRRQSSGHGSLTHSLAHGVHREHFSPYTRSWKRHNGSTRIPVRKLSLCMTNAASHSDFPVHLGCMVGISEAFPYLTDLSCCDVDRDLSRFEPCSWEFAEVDEGGDNLVPARWAWIVSHEEI